ncbi:MAG: carboxypeptidase-like regulatory domain-containing protein, partial [Saprospiraceae bacterium]|nr:carboxypeptidase-like regulatory domain-containing protein [Saprospiraceae bacterium]
DGDSGYYTFEDIVPGMYVVVEVQPLNYDDISDYDHSTGAFDPDGVDTLLVLADNDIPVTLAPGENDEDNNFIEDPNVGTISGYVFDDALTPLSGVDIWLYADTDSNGVADGGILATATTNVTGYFQFTGVEPQYYVLIEDQPFLHSNVSDIDTSITATDLDGDDTVDGPDNDIPVLLLPGEDDEDNIFIDGRPGSICGTVQDDQGNPISNVTIELYYDDNGDGIADAGGYVDTRQTDGDSGNFCFEDVEPRDYVLVEIQPLNYDDVSDYDHTTGAFDPDGVDTSLVLADNDIPVTVAPFEDDFENIFIEDPNLGSISGYVLNDIDTAMAGVTITLYADANGDQIPDGPALTSTTTNAVGYYIFGGVEPGGYLLVETQPFLHNSVSDVDTSITATDLDGDDSADGPDNDIPVIVSAGEADEDNNFVNGRPGSICGSVIEDTGAPISTVTITLYYDDDGDGNPDGAPIASTLTDGDSGNYCFEDLEPRDYVVVETQPLNYDSVSD